MKISISGCYICVCTAFTACKKLFVTFVTEVRLQETVRYVLNRSVSLRLMWYQRSEDLWDQSDCID